MGVLDSKKCGPLLAAPLLLCLAASGCGDANPSDAGQNDAPPTLPTPQSIAIDLGAFGDVGAAKSPAPMTTPGDSSNYTAAQVAVAAIDAAVLGFAAAPIAAFSAAAEATPAKQPDGSWSWPYSVAYDTLSLNLVLNGRADAQGAHWTMRVTTTGLTADVSDFLWCDGDATLDGDIGHLQFYDITTPATPTNLARADWSIDGIDTRSLYWVNNQSGSVDEGDGVIYSQNGSAASLTHLDASAQTSTVVQWDLVTTAGSIAAPGYNGGAPACWQETHLTTDCAQ